MFQQLQCLLVLMRILGVIAVAHRLPFNFLHCSRGCFTLRAPMTIIKTTTPRLHLHLVIVFQSCSACSMLKTSRQTKSGTLSLCIPQHWVPSKPPMILFLPLLSCLGAMAPFHHVQVLQNTACTVHLSLFSFILISPLDFTALRLMCLLSRAPRGSTVQAALRLKTSAPRIHIV